MAKKVKPSELELDVAIEDKRKGCLEIPWDWIAKQSPALMRLGEGAEDAEIKSFKKYDLYDSCPRDEMLTRNLVTSRAVYTLKFDLTTGKLKKLKCRWV